MPCGRSAIVSCGEGCFRKILPQACPRGTRAVRNETSHRRAFAIVLRYLADNCVADGFCFSSTRAVEPHSRLRPSIRFLFGNDRGGGCVWPKQMTSHDGVIRPKVSSSKRFFGVVAPCKQGKLRLQWGGPRVPAPTALCRARHCSVLVSDAKCESPRSIFTCLFCDRHWLRPCVCSILI